MKNKFNNITDILSSGLLDRVVDTDFGKTNRVLKCTRLENEIFREFFSDSDSLQDACKAGDKQLSTFSDLARDVFTSFYALTLNRQNEEHISKKATQFNKPILEELFTDSEYNALKSVCEGRELPAFEATQEFSAQILEKLPELMNKLGNGNSELPNVIDRLVEQAEDLKDKLATQAKQQKTSSVSEKNTIKTAERLDAKMRQIEDLEKTLQENVITAGPMFKTAVSEAAKSAKEKAEEISNVINAWGDGSGGMGNTPVNRELLKKVRANENLQKVARILGKYREIISDKRKNGFTYGLGEKYDITTGNDINLCLSSDLALLASTETQALFLQKYQKKSLKQYRKRESITKGAGDIIVCVDESASMSSVIDWAKAFALALLDIAARDNRRFALIHFASRNDVKIDIFLPGEYTTQDVFRAAEHNFNGGGTDFETPLSTAMKLSEKEFELADIVFITDGECAISEDFSKTFIKQKAERGRIVTGILMDKDNNGIGTSLIPFCDTIYRSSELTEDAIAMQFIK